MAENTEQDRSEQPTPYKLMHARRKGSVARGMDLGYLTALAAFLGFAWIAGPQFGATLRGAFRDALTGGPQLTDGHYAVLSVVAMLLSSVAEPLALLAGIIFGTVLLFEFLQTGAVFSAHPLKPDFSRLNPVNGFKRVFSLRMLVETAKNVLKLCAYGFIGYLILRSALQGDIGSVADGLGLSELMTHTALKLLAAFALAAIFFAALDQIIVRRDFLRKMRMSRRELRREAREREGEPRLKQKRKQLHAEFVKMSQSVRNLRKADVLIVNPQHIALALRYDRKTMQAPKVVSVGTDHLAQRLKRLAFIYGIPVVEDRALARELLRRSGLNQQIPDHCFPSVARIYNGLPRKPGG